MSVTTKTGDKGYTSLLNGKRVHKYDLRIDLMGYIDELTSHIGLAKSKITEIEVVSEIDSFQHDLSRIMASIASDESKKATNKYSIETKTIEFIEERTRNYESMYLSTGKFIMPGENQVSASLHVARAIARRVERQMLSVDRFYPIDENSKVFVNRLSDYLYTLGLYLDFKEKVTKQVKELILEEGTRIEGSGMDRINLDVAKYLLEKVEKKAKDMKLPVVIAVANEWGNIIAVHFMDGALPGSYDIAVDKAYTSAALRLSTETVGNLSQSGAPLYGIGNTNQNRIVTFGGGFPLELNGKVIGGIGVSGGSADDDSSLGLYGAKALENYL